MLDDRTVRGTNFTCFHAGPKEGWMQFRLEPPDVPLPAKGKLFLRNLLGSAGLEMSLNVVLPGKAIPFLHRHQENDEVYVVVGGRGRWKLLVYTVILSGFVLAGIFVYGRFGVQRPGVKPMNGSRIVVDHVRLET